MSPRRHSVVNFGNYSAEHINGHFERMKVCIRRGDEVWLKHLNYRQLQILAKKNDFPSNLKKTMLRTMLRAKMCNRLELVQYYISQVKTERSRRKRMKFARSQEVEKSVNNMNEWNGDRNVKMVKQILCDNSIQASQGVPSSPCNYERQILEVIPMNATKQVMEGVKTTWLKDNENITFKINQQRATVIMPPPNENWPRDVWEISGNNKAIEPKILPADNAACQAELVGVGYDGRQPGARCSGTIWSPDIGSRQIYRPPVSRVGGTPFPADKTEANSRQIVTTGLQNSGESEHVKKTLKKKLSQVTMTRVCQTQSDFSGGSCFTASCIETKYENHNGNQSNYQNNGAMGSFYSTPSELTYDSVNKNQYQSWHNARHNSVRLYSNSAIPSSYNIPLEEELNQNDSYTNSSFDSHCWPGYLQSSGQTGNYGSTCVPCMPCVASSSQSVTQHHGPAVTLYPVQAIYPEYHVNTMMMSNGEHSPPHSTVHLYPPTTAVCCAAPAPMDVYPTTSNSRQYYSNTVPATGMAEVYSDCSSQHLISAPEASTFPLDPPPMSTRYQTNSPQTCSRIWIKKDISSSTGSNGNTNANSTTQLPPFEVFYRRQTNEMVKCEPTHNAVQECQGQGNSARGHNLQFLVDAASCVEQDQVEHTPTRNSFAYNQPQAEITSINGAVTTAVNSEVKDVPTWSNVLQQVTNTSSPQNSVIKYTKRCRFGCTLTGTSNITLLAHEQECMLQPFNCPMVGCEWANQLRALSTHIYTVHFNEVIQGPTANLPLDLSNELLFPSMSGSCKPKRFTYLQLVNTRLFFTSVIVNFQAMQVFIYIQYLNDYRECRKPAAALDVNCSNGELYQWVGEVHPLSHRAMDLHTQRKCLIFNFDPCNLKDVFVIRTMIRAHSSATDYGEI